MENLTLDPRDLSQAELHSYLLSAVAPRPICFASTIDGAGNVNLSPFSFFNVFSSNPPIMVFSPARSGRGNMNKDTFLNIQEIQEVVINVVNYPIVEQMSLSSTAYDKGVNEFLKSGLTQVKSERVRPPRVGESPVAFECTVQQIIELGDQPGSGNLIIAKVELLHIQKQYLTKEGKLDTIMLDLVARMGGSWYARASADALFEIPKPLRTKGMGVDQLPSSITNSNVLTGNNIGRLGNLETLPTQDEIDAIAKTSDVVKILKSKLSKELEIEFLHKLSKEWLELGRITDAASLLMLCESSIRNQE